MWQNNSNTFQDSGSNGRWWLKSESGNNQQLADLRALSRGAHQTLECLEFKELKHLSEGGSASNDLRSFLVVEFPACTLLFILDF